MRITAFILMIFMALALPFAAASAQEEAAPTRPRMIILAGGCFWCMEPPFKGVDGVLRVQTGYAGGGTHNPTYKQVSQGITGHLEVVQVTYDPSRVTLNTLLNIYWRNIDPFDTLGQFCDKGDQYKSAIFVDSPEERSIAERSRNALRDHFRQPIATEIRDGKTTSFYPAEPEHQNYAARNPIRYKFYRMNCKRDKRLKEVWGDEAGGYGFGKRAE